MGLATVGCVSSDQGAVQTNTDITSPTDTREANAREVLFVGQRGRDFVLPKYNQQQGAPVVFTGQTYIGEPTDKISGDVAKVFAFTGIPEANQPLGDSIIQALGFEQFVEGSAGYQHLYPSPTAPYAIGMSRARNVWPEPGRAATLQVLSATPKGTEAEGVTKMDLTPPIDPVSLQSFFSDQGEFVSGVWSPDGTRFYASVEGAIVCYNFGADVGSINDFDAIDFPDDPGGDQNNAVQMAFSPDGHYVFALNNKGASMVVYLCDAATGKLTQAVTVPTVADPRGFAIDRTGKFLYVAGRSSTQLAGYAIQADGGLTPVDLFPGQGFGPVPFNFGGALGALGASGALGDVACNPKADELMLAAYDGFMRVYTIDPQTGALDAKGAWQKALAGGACIANVEVDPSGRFAVTASEDALESVQARAAGGANIFANLDRATNNDQDNPNPLSVTAQYGTNGRTGYVVDSDLMKLTGTVQVWRLGYFEDGSPRAERSEDVANPFGLSFVKVYADQLVGPEDQPTSDPTP